MKHMFVINPVAGGAKGRIPEIESEIKAAAESLGITYEIYFTKGTMDAYQKIVDESDAGEMLRVYAYGGDGTLSECANGAANRSNVAITQYPCGTGNDFLRTFGQENIDKFRDVKALIEGDVRPIDLIDCGDRYGINICSVGIDARIGTDVHKYSGIPLIGGATGYIVSLVVNVIKGVTQRVRITTEDMKLDQKMTLVCACNGRFYGGGFNPVPEAKVDDGIIDYLIVEPVSRLKVAQVVGRYSKGKYHELPDIIKHIRGTAMEIEGDNEFVVNIDGEAVHTKKIQFNVASHAVNFIFPSTMETSSALT